MSEGSRKKRTALSPSYCERCGYVDIVQRHRIKPGSEGGKYKLGNVISLCANGHFKADRDRVRRAELFGIVRTRIEKDLSLGFITQDQYDDALAFIAEQLSAEASKHQKPPEGA